MKTIKSKNTLVIALSLTLCFVLIASIAHAQEKFRRDTIEYGVLTKVERVDVADDIGGHKLSIASYKGVDVNGGIFENQSMLDMVNFNGTQWGYQKTVEKDGSIIWGKFQGKVTGKLTGEGKPPLMSFEGTWSIVKGTGKYKNAVGGGTYKGRFIGDGIFINNVWGTYSIKK